VGDVVVEGEDLLGDGVNVAARLEGIAEAGGICISEAAYQHVRDRIDAHFEDAGEQRLKRIARPVRTYRLRLDRSPAPAKPTLPLPDKPSIAVLPFQNMSGDAEQEYFADGVVEEIITALSRFRQLFVIARNSTFTYKNRAVDARQVGRELGVRYVLEGSVRKAANRVRITAQLIDASTGAHLWADRFDGGLEDIFELQDQVTVRVVGLIAPKLEQEEIERAQRKPTDSLHAYDYYLRGLARYYQVTADASSEALRLFRKAIELDPNFSLAYGMVAVCFVLRKANNWMDDRLQECAEAARCARRAIALGRDDAGALAAGGFTLGYVVGDAETAALVIEQALVLNPNLAIAWYSGAWMKIWLGKPKSAIDDLSYAMRLSPLDPNMIFTQVGTAHAHFFAGRYDEACSWAERVLSEWESGGHAALRIATASHALAGRVEQAKKFCARLQQRDPALRVSNLRNVLGPYRPEDLAKYEAGLRKAGLPE